MREFHHHPDGLIYLRTAEGVYAEALDVFRADLAALGLPDYGGLPDGLRERRHDPRHGHRLFSGDSQFAGERPWPAGDAYLAAASLLITRRAVRQETGHEPADGA